MFGRCSNIVIWSGLHCLVWCIWSERNARNLKDVKNSFTIWSFYSLNLNLSKWMPLLYSILPICLRCMTVILVVLNVGVPVYMDYAPFVFNHWNIYLSKRRRRVPQIPPIYLVRNCISVCKYLLSFPFCWSISSFKDVNDSILSAQEKKIQHYVPSLINWHTYMLYLNI